MKKIRITESALRKIVKESVKQVLNESSNYGITYEDTMQWVKNKKPEMKPEEQHRFVLNILKKTALNTKNSWGSMGKVLKDGRLLSVWYKESESNRYGSVGVDAVYINGKEIGLIKYYTPLVITPNVEPFFEDIKSFNSLIASRASEGLSDEGEEYSVERY
jgi:hypothetical protein